MWRPARIAGSIIWNVCMNWRRIYHQATRGAGGFRLSNNVNIAELLDVVSMGVALVREVDYNGSVGVKPVIG